MHLFDIVGKDKDQRRKSKVFLDKPSFLKRIRRSIVARINIRFWKSMILFGSISRESRIFLRFHLGASIRSLVFLCFTISFGSINPEYCIFLRFRSGASIRSLVFSYDSVREHQLEVSYFSFLSYDFVWEYQLEVSYVSFIFYDSVRERQPGVSYFSYDSTREMWQSLELKF